MKKIKQLKILQYKEKAEYREMEAKQTSDFLLTIPDSYRSNSAMQLVFQGKITFGLEYFS